MHLADSFDCRWAARAYSQQEEHELFYQSNRFFQPQKENTMPQHVVENLTVAQQSKNLTEKDLDATVTAFNELDFQPVVTAGAAAAQRGAPAQGRVIALRRVGKKLVATVETAHASLADSLRN